MWLILHGTHVHLLIIVLRQCISSSYLLLTIIYFLSKYLFQLIMLLLMLNQHLLWPQLLPSWWLIFTAIIIIILLAVYSFPYSAIRPITWVLVLINKHRLKYRIHYILLVLLKINCIFKVLISPFLKVAFNLQLRCDLMISLRRGPERLIIIDVTRSTWEVRREGF